MYFKGFNENTVIDYSDAYSSLNPFSAYLLYHRNMFVHILSS